MRGNPQTSPEKGQPLNGQQGANSEWMEERAKQALPESFQGEGARQIGEQHTGAREQHGQRGQRPKQTPQEEHKWQHLPAEEEGGGKSYKAWGPKALVRISGQTAPDLGIASIHAAGRYVGCVEHVSGESRRPENARQIDAIM